MKDRGFYSYICVFVIDLAGVLRVYLTEIQVGTGEKKKKGQEPLLVIADSGYYKYTAQAANGNEYKRRVITAIDRRYLYT